MFSVVPRILSLSVVLITEAPSHSLPLVFCVFPGLLFTVHGFLDRGVHMSFCLLGAVTSISVPDGMPLNARRMDASTGRVPTYSGGTNGAW